MELLNCVWEIKFYPSCACWPLMFRVGMDASIWFGQLPRLAASITISEELSFKFYTPPKITLLMPELACVTPRYNVSDYDLLYTAGQSISRAAIVQALGQYERVESRTQYQAA